MSCADYLPICAFVCLCVCFILVVVTMAYLLMHSKAKCLFSSAGPGTGTIIIAKIIHILAFDDVFKNMYPSY